SAPIAKRGTILSQIPRHKAASNMLWESAIAVASAITSRLNSDNSIPGSPWVKPSHMAGTPPANWAVAPAVRAASLIIAGKRSNGWCADNMSLYDETMAIFGRASSRSMILSPVGAAAKPCARLVQARSLRMGPLLRALSRRDRYSARVAELRLRIRSVTMERTGWVFIGKTLSQRYRIECHPVRTALLLASSARAFRRLLGKYGKCSAPAVDSRRPEFHFDQQQAIVFGYAVRAAQRAGLDLRGAGGHGQIGDRYIFGFA